MSKRQENVLASRAVPQAEYRMAESRPAIPAELKRKVLVEAGHRCAIPACRHIKTEIHHIIPWKTCKEHKYANLIALCPNCHDRADKGEIDRKSLRSYKAKLRVIHDKFSQLEIDILFELYRESSKRIPCPPFMRILIGRMLDSNYIEYHEKQGTVFISGIKASHDFLSITKEGIEFVNEIKKREM